MRDPATFCSICLHVTQHGSGVKHTHAYAVSKTQRKRISSQLDNTCTLQGKRSPHAPDRSPHVFRPHVSDQLPTLPEHRANGLSPPSPAILPTQQRHRTNEALPASISWCGVGVWTSIGGILSYPTSSWLAWLAASPRHCVCQHQDPSSLCLTLSSSVGFAHAMPSRSGVVVLRPSGVKKAPIRYVTDNRAYA
jgi:hypothetical protein